MNSYRLTRREFLRTRSGFTLIETVISLLIISFCAMVLMEVRENSTHLYEASKEKSFDASKLSIIIPNSKTLSDTVALTDVFTTNYTADDNDIKAYLSATQCAVKNQDTNITVYNQNNLPILRGIENTVTLNKKETKFYRLTDIQK